MKDARAVSWRIAVAVLLILPGSGCREPLPLSPVGLAPAPLLTRGSSEMPVPFRMSGEAQLIAQDFAPGFPGGKSDFDGRCSVPSDFVISFSVSAEATHLGQITARFEHCSQIDIATGATTVSDGSAVMTAANGDELRGTYRTADAPVGTFDEAMRFYGGTGRFEDAGGHALVSAVCDRAAGTCAVEMRGTILYDASESGGT